MGTMEIAVKDATSQKKRHSSDQSRLKRGGGCPRIIEGYGKDPGMSNVRWR